MDKKKFEFAEIFVAIYILLVVVSIIFFILMIKKTPFAGAYIMFLTFPWSFAIMPSLSAAGLIPSIPLVIKIVIFIGCAILNAFLLYKFGKIIEKNW